MRINRLCQEPCLNKIIVTIQSPHSQNCLYEAFLLLMCASRHMNL